MTDNERYAELRQRYIKAVHAITALHEAEVQSLTAQLEAERGESLRLHIENDRLRERINEAAR